MSLAFDEFGRPYIILREQDKKKRLKGGDAFKVLSPLFSFPQFFLFLKILVQHSCCSNCGQYS